jgi:hypothetical protein
VEAVPVPGPAADLLARGPQGLDLGRDPVAGVDRAAVEAELEVAGPAHVGQDAGVAPLLVAEQRVLLHERG